MTSSRTSSSEMGKLFRPWAAAAGASESAQCSAKSSTSAFTTVTGDTSSVHQRSVKKTRRKSSLDKRHSVDSSDIRSGVLPDQVPSSSPGYLGMALAFSEEMAAASSVFDPAAMAASLGCLGNGMYPGMCCPGMQCPDLEAAIEEYGRLLLQETQQQSSRNRKQRPKKFRCPHCQVGFSNNGQLKGHIRIHTGERPYRCDAEHCGKSFTRNEELTRHKRIHSGLRPYPCSACGKRFGRKDHLKKHARTHQVRLHPSALIPVLPPAHFSPYLYAAAAGF